MNKRSGMAISEFATNAASSAPGGDRHAWAILALGWLIYVWFGVAVSSLVPLGNLIRADLDMSYTAFGMILAVWQFVFIFSAIPAGHLVDRIGARHALTLGAGLIALSLLLRGTADSFAQLLMAVALLGIGGPVVSIGLPKLVAELFTGSTRAFASGVYMTGVAVGSVLVLSLSHPLVLPLAGSWRGAQFVYAALALVVLAAWLVLGRGAKYGIEKKAAYQISPPNLSRQSYLQIVIKPAVLIIVLVGFTAFLASHGLRNWLPQILELQGFEPSTAGYLASISALSGILGCLVILRLTTTRPHLRRHIAIALLCMAAIGLIAILHTNGIWLAMAIALEGAASAAIVPLMLNALMELPDIGARHLGAASGIFFSVGELGGAFGPFALGATFDAAGSFAPGIYAMAVICLLAVLPALWLERAAANQHQKPRRTT
jgi:cyanate permease